MTATPAPWTTDDIGDLTGRTAVVTGPSVLGIGFHTALELARHGARVALAGRSEEKLAEAETAIRREVPEADLVPVRLDLASLAAVRDGASELAELGPIHLLVNNAGVMAVPRRRTPDGLDLQLTTNHFGPFLLTGLLLPRIAEFGDGRVVTVSSNGHRMARRPPLDDPKHGPRYYQRWYVYGQTKLANLLFTYELDRRLRASGAPVKALAAHPGFAGTDLVGNGAGAGLRALTNIADAAYKAVAQSPAAGAWPTLMAATADLPGSTYVGPSGRGELAGPPREVPSSRLSHDRDAQRRLWELSEATVGLRYP